LLASLVVAVTLVPMMASKLLSLKERGESESDFYSRHVKNPYRRLIAWVLDHKLITLGFTNLLWLSSIYILFIMPKEFMPTANDETFMIEIELPRGARLEETDKLARKIEQLLLSMPEVKTEHAVIGHSSSSDSMESRQGFFIINLVDQSKRKRTVEQVDDDIRKQVLRIPGISKYNFVNLQSRSIGAGGGKPIEITIYGSDLQALSKLSQEAANRMSKIEGAVDVEEVFTFGSPELQIRFDRERMAQLGLDVARVSHLLETAVKGTVASRYQERGEEFDIRVRLNEKDRDSFLDLGMIRIVTPTGGQIRLSDIASVDIGSGPVRIFRENQKRSVSLLANTLGRDLDSVVRDMKTSLASLDLPMGYFVEYGGSYEDMRDSQTQLTLAALLGMLLVYMIMAAEFESLIQPFTIMLSVPFAFTGSIWAIFLCGMTLSVNSAIGIIMLVGIIVNNGIVLIEYVIQLRERGMPIREALIEAGGTRLRPILMTTLTTILGLIPMALMGGSGSEMRRPLAISLMGGLTFGSILTLLIIPTAYYVFDNLAHRIYMLFMRVLHPSELSENGKGTTAG
jgi:HAE1 family hydrophobic/amphiphilic exporter-1